MDVREKLGELLFKCTPKNIKLEWRGEKIEVAISQGNIADYLIDNGVTVQELDGCEYCKEDSEGFRRVFGAFSLINPFHGKTWQIHAGKCKPREIYFCPMCGRRLP